MLHRISKKGEQKLYESHKRSNSYKVLSQFYIFGEILRPMETNSKVVIFALVAALGLVTAITVDIMMKMEIKSASAYHSLFPTKKECTNFMKNTLGNTTAQAQVMCNKVIPH
jgi:hypothetical protein